MATSSRRKRTSYHSVFREENFNDKHTTNLKTAVLGSVISVAAASKYKEKPAHTDKYIPIP